MSRLPRPISLLNKPGGGPVTSNYGAIRPSNHFSWQEENCGYAGQIQIPENLDALPLGEPIEVMMVLLPDQELRVQLKPGIKWVLQAGARIVGKAKAIEIIR